MKINRLRDPEYQISMNINLRISERTDLLCGDWILMLGLALTENETGLQNRKPVFFSYGYDIVYCPRSVVNVSW